MSGTRGSIFEEIPEELDLSGFGPKPTRDAAAPAPQAVRVVAEAANFRSREAPPPAAPEAPRREPRRYRTGRNVQFNVRASPETLEALYAVSDQQGWLLCQTLERAIAALRREIESASQTAGNR